jgi:CMP-N-acetylneuraminic acid synthetase
MKVVGVILARGGSKSIPLKNIRVFAGKPLIAWTIETALKSGLDRVLVSTDHEDIARVARRHGAEVPFMRPPELSTDTMGVEPVLRHAFEYLRDVDGYHADALMLLPATSPTRRTFHIDDMLDIYTRGDVDSVVAVNETPANHTPFWTLTRQTDGTVTLFGGKPLKHIHTRRQDFPQQCYARNDLGYILKPEQLYDAEKPNLYGNKVELYIVKDAWRYEADINTIEDWHDSEAKFKKILAKERKTSRRSVTKKKRKGASKKRPAQRRSKASKR